MNILVVGAHFYNKGAHLMLEAVMGKLKNNPNYKLYMSPCSGNKEQIGSMGYKLIDFPLKHVTAYRSFNIFFKFGFILKYLKPEYRGDLRMKDIDAIIDISGFAFSDQWGDQAVLNLNKLMTYASKNKMKYIFLPQAFGPFTSAKIRIGMEEVLKKADLVCARDEDSFNFLKGLGHNNGEYQIRQYPDITIDISDPKDEISLLNEEESGYICIVPNERMLDQGREYWPNGKFMEYLDSAINFFLNNTVKDIVVLVHDKGQGDMDMANKIIAKHQGEGRVKLKYEEDPLILKSIIGDSYLIVGSRFHALVSALSQNIPSIALGWSHKYKTLFSEFEVSDFSFEVPNDDSFNKKLHEITTTNERTVIKSKLRNSNIIHREKLSAMWGEVHDILSK